jgi:sigma-B regulation protein RsbU (phosphoserine phosphatase)
MQTRALFDHIRGHLIEQRRNLAGWLQSTPAPERMMRLNAASDHAVSARLELLDVAIQKAEDQTLGMCEVCHDTVNARLLLMDYTSCVCLEHYTPEERRRLERELELSQVVQRALLPQVLPEIPGVQVAAFSRPAEIVGGDYFDFFRFRDGTYGLAIADVAGHGVSAGMIMASVQTALHTLVPLSETPLEVVQQLNRFFSRNVHVTMFITLFLARLDPASLILSYCNAGHNPPLVLHAPSNGADAATWLRPTGPAIGLVDDYLVTEQSTDLQLGDLMLFYTDGVIEATNPMDEEFGESRLVQLVQEQAHLAAPELVEALRHELNHFTAGKPLEDDTTVVACKVTP